MAVSAPSDYRIVPAGDSTLLVEFEERIDIRINTRSIALADGIRSAAIAGVRDVVPTYRSVAVYFDPLRTDYDGLVSRLAREADGSASADDLHRTPIVMPVCYGGEFGPDLLDVASATGLTPQEVVERHTSVLYRVFMLGFVPGFAYMGLLDPRLSLPRRQTPRTRVPGGSVAIAGNQTGVYPTETPGGWHILGRTPVRQFDINRAEPFLLRPGDAVRFAPIDASAFHRIAAGNA